MYRFAEANCYFFLKRCRFIQATYYVSSKSTVPLKPNATSP